MNSFGRIFRVSIFGESHGPSVGIIIDGVPAGLSLGEDDFTEDLERRKGGMQKGTTPRKEDDKPIFLGGLFNGYTTGAPLTIMFENKNTRSGDYEKQRDIPRPGHADFVAHEKFKGFEDFRGGGHFSGRLTVCLVAAGVVAKKLLDLTPSPSPKERGTQSFTEPGYLTNTVGQWNAVLHHAKQNRINQTKAESILWEELRNRKLDDCKFRRQHPVEAYIPDFICLDKKLIIEIDGDYHDSKEQKKLDEHRTEIFTGKGYKVLRFTNHQVETQLTDVLQKISESLSQPGTPGVSNSSSPLERRPGGEVSNAITITTSILEIGGEADIETGLQKAIDAKDSVGGIIECTVKNLPIGLGQPFFDSVESVLAHAVFSIPAVKGIEFGAGFSAAKMFGSQHNDAIINAQGTTSTNHAGGVVGGLTNGNDLVFRVVVKPTSSTPIEQQSWNWETSQVEKFSVKGRHDLCIALRVPPVLEAVAAIVLADLVMLEQGISHPLLA